jgi:hypothetical protein
MKRKIILFGSIILFSCILSCATNTKQASQSTSHAALNYGSLNPELYPTDIPNNVRYNPPPESDCILSKELLEKALKKNEGGAAVGLFNGVVAICPSMWSEVKSIEPYKSDPGPKVMGMVDGEVFEGKGLRKRESLNALELYIRNKLNAEGPVTVRPPNRIDLIKYWAVISWDLDSPLFVAESSKSKYIFQFSDGRPLNVVLLR